MSISRLKLIEAITKIAPEGLAEDWDHCGIQIDLHSNQIFRILISLEITSEIIEEAKEINANFIITHHPLIFTPIKEIDVRDTIGNYIVQLIQNKISVYSAHTSFDKVSGGNNTYLANLLQLTSQRKMDLGREKSDSEFLGIIGDLKDAMNLREVCDRLAGVLDISKSELRVVGDANKCIQTVGICTGAGADLIEAAALNGCDLFITGDMKYHDAMKAKGLNLCVLDAGHYATEKSFAQNFSNKLKEVIGAEVEVVSSKINIDPFTLV